MASSSNAARRMDDPETGLGKMRERLASARSITVLTGSGISAESGLPTFRGAGGLWRTHRVEELASPHGFARDPALVWSWYAERRTAHASVQPSAAHAALAAIERRARDFTLVTQNVDSLHRLAGSRNVLELHGALRDAKCTRCDARAALDGVLARIERDGIAAIEHECGGRWRPDIVWFGEALPADALDAAFAAARRADLMLVVGTSGLVQPAASLATKRVTGACVVEINPEETALTAHVDVSASRAGIRRAAAARHVSAVQHGAGAFVVLLAAATLVAILAERVRVPAAVALVAVGALVPINPPFAFGDTLLFVFLPPLIFEAAWNLDRDALRRTASRIALLAVPGTIATAAIVGGVLVVVRALPTDAAALFGAIVAATDPIAVVAAFRGVAVPARLRTLVEGESLANDGVALVLFGFMLAVASGHHASFGLDALFGVAQVAGGLAIGCAAGALCAAVLRATDASAYEVTVTIVLAYGAYLCAGAAHCSGIFATAAGAVVLRAIASRVHGAVKNVDEVDSAWNALAFITNAVVFLSTGLLIRPERIAHEPGLVIAAVLAVWLARGALSLCAGRSTATRLTLFFAGMRGALPLALALSLPASLPHRPQIIDATFAVVLVTIVVQGMPLGFIVRRLFPPGTPAAAS